MKILNEASDNGISVYIQPNTSRPLSYSGCRPTYEVRVEKDDYWSRVDINDSYDTLSEFIEEAIRVLEYYIEEQERRKVSQ